MTGPGAPSGLRRFVKRPADGRAGLPPAIQEVLAARAAERQADEQDGTERCEMCREVLGQWHGHVVDLEERSLACTCRACYLLFTQEGAAGGRYRAVPEHVYHDPDHALSDAEWGELQIPVAMAFFFYNSAIGQVVAGYPSPAGATECELDLAAWDRLAADHPLLGGLAPDVEAILVNRAEGRNEMFLIPVDECYALVGELRMKWQGFDGGAEAHLALDAFLDGLRRRAVPRPARDRQPRLSQPQPSQPQPSQPELSQPQPSQSELSQPQPSQSELSQPQPSQSELSQPELERH